MSVYPPVKIGSGLKEYINELPPALKELNIYHVDTLPSVIYYVFLAIEIVIIYGFWHLVKSGAIDKHLLKFSAFIGEDIAVEGLEIEEEVSIRTQSQVDSDLMEIPANKIRGQP